MATQETQAIPPWLNPIMKFILRSPLHGLVSSKIMLISFKGRRTGHEFTTPVSYMQQGNTVTFFTHSRWWRNLLGGADVTVQIRGKKMHGHAVIIAHETEMVADGLREHLLRNHVDAQFYHVSYDDDGKPNADDLRRGAQGVVMVKLRTA